MVDHGIGQIIRLSKVFGNPQDVRTVFSRAFRAGKEVVESAAKHVDDDIAVDVGIIGTAVEIAVSALTAQNRGHHIANDGGIVTATKDFADDQFAATAFVDDQVDFVDVAITVAAAIQLIDEAAVDSGVGCTINVGRGG